MSRNQRRNRRNKQGGGQNANRNAARNDTEDRSTGAVLVRSSTETKSSLKTTELIAYAGAVLAVVMTALAVDEDGRGGNDPFGAESAIRYITYLTIGYMIARGLAKSGSHENRIDHDDEEQVDDNVARTLVSDDEDVREDDGDELDVEPETAETAVRPSDDVQRAAADPVDGGR